MYTPVLYINKLLLCYNIHKNHTDLFYIFIPLLDCLTVNTVGIWMTYYCNNSLEIKYLCIICVLCVLGSQDYPNHDFAIGKW